MTTLTFGGKPITAPQATQPALPTETPGADVLVVFRLIALNLEARRELVWAIEAAREIDVDALNDPALADHPRRPAMLRLYEDRCRDERLAVLKLAELNVSLARQWGQIQTSDKNRYALTELVGADPEQDPLLVLWSDTCGLAKLVPFPDGWAVPLDLSHRVLDPSIEVREHTAEELFHAPSPPF